MNSRVIKIICLTFGLICICIPITPKFYTIFQNNSSQKIVLYNMNNYNSQRTRLLKPVNL